MKILIEGLNRGVKDNLKRATYRVNEEDSYSMVDCGFLFYGGFLYYH